MRLLLLFVVALFVAACGGGDGDDDPEPIVTDTFPHVEGAEQIDAATLSELPFELVFSDPVATLHIVDVEPMELSSFYSAGFIQGVDGWTGSSIGASQYAQYSMYQNGSRIAVMTTTGTKLFIEAPEIAAELDLTPFDLNGQDFPNDETLIYTLFFTCDEAAIEACLQAVFNARAPGL